MILQSHLRFSLLGRVQKQKIVRVRPQFASLSSLLNHIKTNSGIVVVIVQFASFGSLLKQTRRISYADSPNRRFPPKKIRAMFHGLQTYNLISATSRTNTRSCATDRKEIPQKNCHRKQSKSLRMELASQDRIVVFARSGPHPLPTCLGNSQSQWQIRATSEKFVDGQGRPHNWQCPQTRGAKGRWDALKQDLGA